MTLMLASRLTNLQLPAANAGATLNDLIQVAVYSGLYFSHECCDTNSQGVPRLYPLQLSKPRLWHTDDNRFLLSLPVLLDEQKAGVISIMQDAQGGPGLYVHSSFVKAYCPLGTPRLYQRNLTLLRQLLISGVLRYQQPYPSSWHTLRLVR